MTDLHEVGVVSGIEGIEAVLKENEATDLNLYFVVPSHVPFSPALETSGGSFNPDIIRKALQREDAVGISECVGPYILAGFPDLMESLDDVAGMKGHDRAGSLGGDERRGSEQVRGRRRVYLPRGFERRRHHGPCARGRSRDAARVPRPRARSFSSSSASSARASTRP